MTELKLRTGGATHRGAHRENNEDSMVVAGSLCVVADGMGAVSYTHLTLPTTPYV